MSESKFSFGKLIAQTTLVKMIFLFSIIFLLFVSGLVNSKVEILAYIFSLLPLGVSFVLIYLLSVYLLSISKELSREEKNVVCFTWFFVCIVVIISFSILHSLVNTSNQSNFIYFSVITFTTVGYGDVLPSTVLGYIFCVSEAFVGLVLLAMLIAGVKSIFSAGRVKLWHLFISLIILIIIPSLIYSYTGILVSSTGKISYGFFDTLYFSAVTLSTLGYGDFYPSQLSQVVASFQAFFGYLFFGVFSGILADKYFPNGKGE